MSNYEGIKKVEKEFNNKDRMYKEFTIIDKNFLIKTRLYLTVVFFIMVIAPNINYLKFNINFNLLDFIHSDTNIALIWGFICGMVLMSMLIVTFVLESIKK